MRGRLILGFTIVLGFRINLPISAQQAVPRVSIRIPTGDFESRMPFVAHLDNGLSVPIDFCVDFGKSVETAAGLVAAPDPFYLQRRTQRQWRRRWDTQLTGTDVGGGPLPFSVEARQSADFTLQVTRPGRYRLRLRYTAGGGQIQCALPRKNSVTVSSKQFLVHESSKEIGRVALIKVKPE